MAVGPEAMVIITVQGVVQDPTPILLDQAQAPAQAQGVTVPVRPEDIVLVVQDQGLVAQVPRRHPRGHAVDSAATSRIGL